MTEKECLSQSQATKSSLGFAKPNINSSIITSSLVKLSNKQCIVNIVVCHYSLVFMFYRLLQPTIVFTIDGIYFNNLGFILVKRKNVLNRKGLVSHKHKPTALFLRHSQNISSVPCLATCFVYDHHRKISLLVFLLPIIKGKLIFICFGYQKVNPSGQRLDFNHYIYKKK